MVTTVILMVHGGAKMAQQKLAKNGLWGPNLNTLKITVAYVGKVIVITTLEISIASEYSWTLSVSHLE